MTNFQSWKEVEILKQSQNYTKKIIQILNGELEGEMTFNSILIQFKNQCKN
jgi:hypothetical protein